ncbi:MAG: FHA domain-containing protein [Planctomycetes bacterium]|nr:FHA domain-containing protein [Planctomycetota bacterium]
MPRITFKKNEHPAVELHQAVVVGRSEQHANVVVKDSRLSRAHCRFEPQDDGTWMVSDLGSQNGTFVNGKRIKESLVKGGDVVTIGGCDMAFEAAAAGKAAGQDFGSDRVARPTQPKADSTRTVVAPAALVLVAGSLTDKIHPITSDEFTIGRKKGNHICLEGDTKASGNHAVIRRKDFTYTLEDLGSTNGVMVNGHAVTAPVVLKPGARVAIGLQTFEFKLQGRPDQSSGETAPALAAAEVKAKAAALSPPGQAGDTGDLRDPGEDSAAESAVDQEAVDKAAQTAEIVDRAALTQKVAKVSGGTVFSVLEVLVVVLVAGGVLYAAWAMTRDQDGGGIGDDAGVLPARDGGLLTSNPSFDERDDSGFAKGWRYEVAGTDSFTLVEGAHGGPYAMLLSRFSPANAASFVVSSPVDVAGAAGVRASAFALNSEMAQDRLGSAVLAVFWFENAKDREPLLVSPLAIRTRLDKWTELTGAAAAPRGAKAFSVALGICGASGSVAFDDVTVSRADEAERWAAPAEAVLPGGLIWRISEAGTISLSGPDGELLRGGRVTLHAADGRNDPLDPLLMLTQRPAVTVAEGSIYAKYLYFDPVAAAEAQFTLELAGKGGKAEFAAGVSALHAGELDNGSRRVALNVLATPAFVPAELIRLEGDQLMEYRTEIGDSVNARRSIGTLLAANTGTGNRLSAAGAVPAAVSATVHPLGRELFLQSSPALALVLTLGEKREELRALAVQVAAVQPGEDQLDRVTRAITIFREFLYNQDELAMAAAAVDAAGKHYKLRLVELRDGVNVPQLTRNEQLYRAAMDEAISISARLSTMKVGWETEALPVLRNAAGAALSKRTRDAADKARNALNQLIEVSTEFDALAQVARRARFILNIETQQRDCEPFLVSAQDFLAAGQYVQGMLKLRMVVKRYPHCPRGIEAKERMVDVATVMLDEMDQYRKQNLNNIAKDRALTARDLLDVVEANLLARLTDEEKRWLSEMEEGEDHRKNNWLERESALVRRINELRNRLPKDLPPPAEEDD